MSLTIAEVQYDLANTRRDFSRLNTIVENLKLFIKDSGGEDRSFLKPELMKFERLLVQAEQLMPQIENQLQALRTAAMARTEQHEWNAGDQPTLFDDLQDWWRCPVCKAVTPRDAWDSDDDTDATGECGCPACPAWVEAESAPQSLPGREGT